LLLIHLDLIIIISLSIHHTAFMATSPLVPYVAQYIEMNRNKTSEGFSTYVCLILLAANILRVFFWIGKRFDTVLLVQSFLLIAFMFVLLELCVRLKTKTSYEKNSLLDGLSWANFWNWDDFASYVVFVAGATFLVGLLTVIFLDSSIYVELLGFCALATEATLGVPQVLRNHKKKSVAGVSNTLIASWFLGDIWKTYYFLSIGAPAQFVYCGVTQIAIDCVFAYQVYAYTIGFGGSRKQFSE
jgi:chromate transport protein ChrA